MKFTCKKKYYMIVNPHRNKFFGFFLVAFSLACGAVISDWFYHSTATCSPLAHHGNSLSHLIRYLIHNKSILISFMFGGRREGYALLRGLCAVRPPPSTHHAQLFSAASHLHTWYQLISWLLSADYWWRASGCIWCCLLYQGHAGFVSSAMFVFGVFCVFGRRVKHVLKLLLIKVSCQPEV